MEKKNLLVIDDDELFLSVLKSTLEKNGYSVTACSNAQGAQHLFLMSDFDGVISDIQLGGAITGIDLLTQFKKERANVPFVLMTGFSEIIETINAATLGANGFLPKPFRQEQLLATLNSFFLPAAVDAKVGQGFTDDDYMKLNIDDFISGKDITYDIFVRLNSGKYIKIGNQGEDIPQEQIKNYRTKGLHYLYLKKEDFKKYVGFNLKLATVVSASKNVDRAKKINFLKHTNELILSQIFTVGIDDQIVEQSSELLKTTVDLLADDQDLFVLLESLNSHTDHLYAHSLAVSMYSTMIARKLNYTTASVLFKISFAGIFHDIGKKEIDRTILDAPRNSLTPAQIQIYESHSFRGMEIMSQIKGTSTEVIQTILQHHENCSGTGVPSRLLKSKIHPFAKIVNLANDFSKYVVKGAHSEAILPGDAIERMLIYPERYDRQALIALLNIFKVPLPEGLASNRT